MTIFVATAPAPEPLGPRLAVKDNIDVVGYVSGCGVNALAEANASSDLDAPCVVQAREAGLRVVGKTTMSQLAIGAEGINPDRGTPINPADPRRVPGGSSSGSAAAVGAGLADLALGSDTGGSVRVPASCCGVVGMRFTPAAVSLAGVAPLAPSLDAIGVLAPTAASLSLAECWIGPLAATHAKGLRVAWLAGIAPQLDAFCPADLPQVRPIGAETWEKWYRAGSTVLEREAASQWWWFREGWDNLADDVRMRLCRGAKITQRQAAVAYGVMREARADLNRLLGAYDAIAMPMLPHGVPLLDAPRTPIGTLLGDGSTLRGQASAPLNYLSMPVNVLGLPALSLPVNPIDHPMPSMQLIGRPFADRDLVAIAQARYDVATAPRVEEGVRR